MKHLFFKQLTNKLFKVLFAFTTATAIGQLPTTTSFTPDSGVVCTNITITGIAFNTIVSNNTAYLCANKADFISATSTLIVIAIPSGATHSKLSVTNLGTSRTATSSQVFFSTCINPSLSTIIANSFTQFDITTTTTPATVTSAFWSDVRHNGAVADFDYDGKVDLVKVNNTGASVRVYRNISSRGVLALSSFTTNSLDFATLSDSRDSVIGDLNNDGKLDTVVTNNKTSISILTNTSSGSGIISFAVSQNLTVSSCMLIRIADLDNDGLKDVI